MNHRRETSFLLLAFALNFCGACLISASAAEADDLFESGAVPHLQLTIAPDAMSSLRTNARAYVRAVVREGTSVWSQVGVHLKGSIGSFRSIDGKPGWTLSFDQLSSEAPRFHGLRKLHLDNAVEDPGYLNELLGNELFRDAGIPAPRVTHATVELNGRSLGLYVLKEGFTEEFLGRFFRHPVGNFYDITREGHDVNEAMEKDFGKGPPDRIDLEALAAAALEPDLQRRQERFRLTLDVERFLSFMAMEILLGHRDGYCLARNNFRVYQDVDSGRMVFIPHGMDQLFGNAHATIQPMMNGLVARSFLEIRENRTAFRQRCAFLTTNVLRSDRISQRIDQALARLRPVLDHDARLALEHEAAALKERVQSRITEVEKQLRQAPLELLRFESNVAALSGWQAVDVPEGGELTRTTVDGRTALTIRAGPVTSASWRTRVLLPRGKYRFEGELKTAGVARLKFGKNHGAVLKSPRVTSDRTPPLLGNQPWKSVQLPFEVDEREQEVELICELRAGSGTAWFDLESLRLVRQP